MSKWFSQKPGTTNKNRAKRLVYSNDRGIRQGIKNEENFDKLENELAKMAFAGAIFLPNGTLSPSRKQLKRREGVWCRKAVSNQCDIVRIRRQYMCGFAQIYLLFQN